MPSSTGPDNSTPRIEDNPKWIRGYIDGRLVVDSRSTKFVWEVPWYPAWYIPVGDVSDPTLPTTSIPELPDHVRLDLLTGSETSTGCPYKGFARYWGADIAGNLHPDIAWSYATPLPESTGVAGLICFYDERVEIEIDGVSSGAHAG